MNAWASVRLSRECGLGLVSGSRQHMPDTALWGPAFIPRCFHSPTFGRCTKKVFSQVFAFQQKKKKKVLAFTFAHTWITAFHLIPNIFQSCSKAEKICTISFSAPSCFGNTWQANKLHFQIIYLANLHLSSSLVRLKIAVWTWFFRSHRGPTPLLAL